MFDALAKHTLVPLILRLVLAVIFIYHGQALIFAEKNEWGSAWMKPKPGEEAQPAVVQLAVAWGQLLGGIALAAGFLTRLAALGIIAIMAGAIALVHWEHGFDIREGGYEYNFALIAMCLALVLSGAGPLSIDRLMVRRKQ
jgi:putative oxidoreductase